MKWAFLLLAASLWGQSWQLISVCYTPDSVLQKPHGKLPLAIENRYRFASCSDVAWSPDGAYLAAVGLLDKTIWMYELENRLLKPIRRFSSEEGVILRAPEKLQFSSDSKLLMVPDMKKLTFFSFDKESLSLKLKQTIHEDSIVHGAAFSSDNRYVAYVTIGRLGRIELLCKTDEQFVSIQSIQSPVHSMVPKAIAFSADQRFIAICFSINAGIQGKKGKSLMKIYPFDSSKGKIEAKSVSSQAFPAVLESIAFTPDETAIFSVDQSSDQIISYPFDKQSGNLDKPFSVLSNPTASLSFPHGLSFSPNGRYLAISNYGDDKITLYEVSP